MLIILILVYDDILKIVMPESPDQLVRDSAHGHLQTVKDILNKYPNVRFFMAQFVITCLNKK